MSWLYVAGLVWLGCSAIVVLGLCVAAHGVPPSVEEFEGAHDAGTLNTHDQSPDWLREAA